MTDACALAASGQIPNAAQASAVVLRLLRLQTVSPHPPSALAFLASHCIAFTMSESHFAPARAISRLANASATSAVAVESALADSLPVHTPSRDRRSSSLACAKSRFCLAKCGLFNCSHAQMFPLQFITSQDVTMQAKKIYKPVDKNYESAKLRSY